jgi:hypothetical protein
VSERLFLVLSPPTGEHDRPTTLNGTYPRRRDRMRLTVENQAQVAQQQHANAIVVFVVAVAQCYRSSSRTVKPGVSG